MQHEYLWEPSKFIKSKKLFRATKDITKVGYGYRFIGDIQAKNYSELIQEYASGVLLDLGCGNVSLYEMYKPYVEKIYCADWPNTFHKNLFLDFNIDLNKPFPLFDNLFDTILLTDVLEHVAHPENLWKEITRIMKPGGKIILGVPFFHLLHEEPYDYFRYTEFRLKMYCEDNNLRILKIYPYGGSLEILIDIFAKHFSFSKNLSNIYYLFSRFLVKTIIGKKIYKLTSSKYPLGYCLVAQK